MIKQALISVSDKTGVLDFARALSSLGVSILSTGGTAKLLLDNGVACTEVADYTWWWCATRPTTAACWPR